MLSTKLKMMSLHDTNLETPDNELDEPPSRMNNMKSSRLLSEETSSVQTVPDVFMLERIVFVVDTSSSSKTNFSTSNDQSVTALTILKMMIETFVRNKSVINRDHEYAIITLEGSKIQNHCPLTNDINHFLYQLRCIQETSIDNQSHLSLDNVFNEVHKLMLFMDTSKKIMRVILLYTRYMCTPIVNTSVRENYFSYKALKDDDLFYFDVVLVYGKTEGDEDMIKLRSVIQSLVSMSKKSSYMYIVMTRMKTICENMAQLLAHPLQRKPQNSLKLLINELLLTP